MNIENLQDLKNEITKLEKIHHLKIFKILKNNDIKYSENRNGIFVNMAALNTNTLDLIKKELLYIKQQEKHLKDIELVKDDLKEDFFINHKQVKDNNNNNNIPNELS
jgi:hypothetical protein